MEYICGIADFSDNQKFNPPKIFDGFVKIAYSGKHVMLCGNSTAFSENKNTLKMSIDDTCVTYNPESEVLDFSCGNSGLHRLFFTFVGSAFIFSTDLYMMVYADEKPFVLLGTGKLGNISEVKYGKSGTFSPEGLKFH